MTKFKKPLLIDNIITRYTEWTSKKSGGYVAMKALYSLVMMGHITDKKVFTSLNFSTKPIYPNIWVLTLARTSTGRKSTSKNELMYCMNNGENGGSEIFPLTFSKESIPEILSENGHLIICNDEVGDFFASAKKVNGPMAGVKDMFCKLYDCPSPEEIKKQLAGMKKFTPKNNIYIGALLATTPERFVETCSIRDFESGLLMRVLVVNLNEDYVYRKIDEDSKESEEEGLKLHEDVVKLRKIIAMFESIELEMSKLAIKVHDSWLHSYTGNIGDIKSKDTLREFDASLSTRLSIYIIKIAQLFYVGSPEFVTDALRRYETDGKNIVLTIPDCYYFEAFEFVRGYIWDSMHEVVNMLSKGDTDTVASRIINILGMAGPEGCSRSDLAKTIGGANANQSEISAILDRFEEEGIIVRDSKFNQSKKNKRSYSKEMIYLVTDNDVNYDDENEISVSEVDFSLDSKNNLIGKDSNGCIKYNSAFDPFMPKSLAILKNDLMRRKGKSKTPTKPVPSTIKGTEIKGESPKPKLSKPLF